MGVASQTKTTVAVNVELFGNAQLIAGQRLVPIRVASDCALAEMAEALGRRHPGLVGKVIRPDISGFLNSYAINLNGIHFMGNDRMRLENGDSLLVFSSQAGGQ